MLGGPFEAATMVTTTPTIHYPDELPITARRAEILSLLREHQVLVVSGETGSGKSTQLPKLCLELGRGRDGLIGHTQPRRLAARTVAERVGVELGTEVGDLVGYAVRFTDRVGPAARVKVMTDGILLAEVQRDRDLRRYDTIIVDEAHERSLNVDFLLGYLKALIERRPELKVVITSATIDTDRFARHFGDAPVVEVSGRTYPVEVRYRPYDQDPDDDRDQVQAVTDAVRELAREGPGDVLVFLSGEREIHDTADAVRRLGLRDTEVLPLYARLSAAEQHRIFAAHPGRRVVLATNVAETSLTVPGVRFVIDAGTARISRYSRRLKVQRLPIEAVSRASADQRAGRCGRVAPGVCIRLYSQDDYENRPAYTEPEILRTNLASVILQMTALGIGDVARFPFVDPPDARSIDDGVALLVELGALRSGENGGVRLTRLGRKLARLPIDPRLGRMILEADRNGCVREVIVIAAALSIQDPRERPAEAREEATHLHRRFADADSDFLTLLNLWAYLRQQQRELSSSQFRRLCRAEHLNHLRVREWQDLVRQLRQVSAGVGITDRSAPDQPDAIHRSILAGLLSQVGMKQDREDTEYLGARNARFSVARDSVLSRRRPRWVMAGELVETNRLWARMVARVRPEWVEDQAAQLVKRSYGEPRWDAARGRAMTTERVTLYGLPVVAGRAVNYDRVDPAHARALLIHHGLIEGEWETHLAFPAANRRRVDEVLALEARVRRRDLYRGDDALFDFYDRLVPVEVTSTRHLERWANEQRDRAATTVPFEDIVDRSAGPVDLRAWPDTWRPGDLDLELSYRFEPGAVDDGITVHVPVGVLNRLPPSGFDWLVPGLREELVAALIRTLPKAIRRHLGPAPDRARQALSGIGPDDGPLLGVLAAELTRLTGAAVRPDSWDPDRLPPHLRARFSIEDDQGRTLAVGEDLAALQRALRSDTRTAIAQATEMGERSGLTDWPGGDLLRVVEAGHGGRRVRGYPALVDEGTTAGVRILATEAEQGRLMPRGTRRLLLASVPVPRGALQRDLPNGTRLALAGAPYASVPELLDDCATAAADAVVAAAGGPAWTEDGFKRLQSQARDQLGGEIRRLALLVGEIVSSAVELGERTAALAGPLVDDTVDDVTLQLARLLHPGFVTAAGADRLPDLLRYLRAIRARLDKLGTDPIRDQARAAPIRRLQADFDAAVAAWADGPVPDDLVEVRWLLEELRVSVFAQSLGTRVPVSEQRIRRRLDGYRPTG
jgi:ATP-dependent helicase HrpA